MKTNPYIFLLTLFLISSLYLEINCKSFLQFRTEVKKMNSTENSEFNLLIDNAIYVIRIKDKSKNLDIENNIPVFLNNPKKTLKKHFRIFAIDKKTKNQTYTINSDNFYCIEDKDFHKRIGVNNNGEVGLFIKNDNDFKNERLLWIITPKIIENDDNDKTNQRLYYYIQNVATGQYLSVKKKGDKLNFVCNTKNVSDFNDNNYFVFNKMYREEPPYESMDILEKEPIDVLIKYIDLSDPKLNREGIKQIPKDESNNELKYSVRSILKYIPWIRKIFILMPNEKVSFFKPPEEIKDKIVYVKDKDLLGFDSASSPAFQFNLWRMKHFGMSENFILMDDDYFIGRPLSKSNFFYEENGKVYPALVTRDFYELSKNELNKILAPLLAKKQSTNSHSPNGFTIMQKNSLLFLYNIFGEDNIRYEQPLIEPSFTHNAIPVKQSDIKEIYDYIEKLYPYEKQTLLAKERELMSLQPQTLFMGYAMNRYDRRVKMLTSSFFDLTQFKKKPETDLFVVNVSTRNYAKNYFSNEIKLLESLYPEKTPYELDGINGKQNENKDNNKNKNEEKNSNNNDKKNDNEKDKKTDNEKDKKNNKEKKNNEENENDINYQKLMDYLKIKYLERKNLKADILEINNKLKELVDKYNKLEEEYEKLEEYFNSSKIIYNNVTNEIKNNTINHNKKINENENEQSQKQSKYKIFFAIISIIIMIGIIIYLIKNRNIESNINNHENYFDINSQRSENEMSLMNSKIDI